jgi:predicted nuclease with TOPRIM domain
MNKFSFSVFFVLILCIIMSCGGKGKDAGNPEADSLRNVLNDRMAEMSEMDLFLDAVNASMDSVIDMDGKILRTLGENKVSRKQQILNNIEAYKQILQRQRDRLSLLEEKLKANGELNAKNEKLMKTIGALKKQIEEKDKAIVELAKELENRKYDIKTLKGHVEKLNTQVAELQEETKQQEEALVTQSDMMNEAYVCIGSKKELKEAGLLTGGSVFKKSKLNLSQVNASAFQKIDIRQAKTFKIPGKKATVLTQMPEGSYTITDNGDGTTTLAITDATRFWSISNYLIIRY